MGEVTEIIDLAEIAGRGELHGHPGFYALLMQMAKLHSKKNHDYSGDDDPLRNLRTPTKLGIDPFIGVLIRLEDKWSRLEQFAKTGILEVENEKIEDTLMDNAVYSLLGILLLREQSDAGKELKDNEDEKNPRRPFSASFTSGVTGQGQAAGIRG